MGVGELAWEDEQRVLFFAWRTHTFQKSSNCLAQLLLFGGALFDKTRSREEEHTHGYLSTTCL